MLSNINILLNAVEKKGEITLVDTLQQQHVVLEDVAAHIIEEKVLQLRQNRLQLFKDQFLVLIVLLTAIDKH